jgi:DhnA family fructose-bisphosphate aldolase class Ia
MMASRKLRYSQGDIFMTDKTRRMARLFAPDGKSLVVAMDHAGFMDTVQRGLETPRQLIRDTAEAGADSFLITLGSAQQYAADFGNAGVWLSVDAQPPFLEKIVETALRIGADGVKCLVYPWWDEQPQSLTYFTALAAECSKWGLPVMAEVIPGGFMAKEEMRTVEKISAASRVAMEAGADVIKTFFVGDAKSFRAVVENCPVPLVVLGGARTADENDLFNNVREALEAGASGIAIGRNIWQHPQPGRITASLAKIVHGKA